MICMKFTFLIFQEGQPDEEIQTIVEFEDATELAKEMARLAAHNSIVFTHPMVRRLSPPGKILSRVNPRKGIGKGTAILVKEVRDVTQSMTPEFAHDMELLYHAAVARVHAARTRNNIN